MVAPIVGSGISSQVLFLPETTYGVYPAGITTTARTLEFNSETFEMKKTTVQGQGLHAGGLYDRLGRRVLTNYSAAGALNFDIPNRNLNYLLQQMTGSPNTSFAPAASLYVPVQLTTSGAYQSYHTPGNTYGLSMTFQKGAPTADLPGSGAVEPFTYVGGKVTDWEISVATGALAKMVLTWDFRNELAGVGNSDPLNASVPVLGTYTEPGTATDPLYVFHFREATLFTGGTPTTTTGVLTMAGEASGVNIKSASIKETHKLDTTRYFLGSQGFKAEPIENGFRSLTGSFMAEWLAAEVGGSGLYSIFSADTTYGIQLSFVGSIAGTAGTNKDTLTITVPNIKLDGEPPKISGPGVVTQNITWTGLDDQINPVYQINYISSDTAP
jgi:hypothetical protein